MDGDIVAQGFLRSISGFEKDRPSVNLEVVLNQAQLGGQGDDPNIRGLLHSSVRPGLKTMDLQVGLGKGVAQKGRVEGSKVRRRAVAQKDVHMRRRLATGTSCSFSRGTVF
ncbi:hypothetical protein LOK49_LG12G02332 [Camellia lanceoleosa]|uniref:Uncharacterized protein n=1 Tax=Camellia lanceoleosa TaxID=1840588 RepID=A0ACC0FVR3_9ERIC|nr:hypothetical protein LOK49_LG12G02332 [Camellia lanceoleosa]